MQLNYWPVIGMVFLSVISFAAFIDSRAQYRTSRLQKLLGQNKQDPVEKALLMPPKKKIQNPFLGLAKRVTGSEIRSVIELKLKYAGYPRMLNAEEFLSLRLTFAALAFASVSVLGIAGMGVRGIALGVLMSAIGYLLPDLWLSTLIRKRRRDIEKDLLGYIDMLYIAVEAGLSLDAAITRVSQRYNGLLGQEFQQYVAEVQVGKLRSEALRELGSKHDSSDLLMFTGALAQSEEHGTPVANILRDVSSQLQQKRRNRAQELTQKATVKVLFVIIPFMFVPLMVLLVGPAIMNIVVNFGF